MRKLDLLAATLVLVGGLNWGLVGIAKFDLVAWIFGGMDFGETNAASRVVDSLVAWRPSTASPPSSGAARAAPGAVASSTAERPHERRRRRRDRGGCVGSGRAGAGRARPHPLLRCATARPARHTRTRLADGGRRTAPRQRRRVRDRVELAGLRGVKAGITAAQAENLAFWPAFAMLDRVHPDRRDGSWPPLLRNRRIALYEVIVHALFGSILGALVRR